MISPVEDADLRILRQLQRNCLLSNNELADAAGLSASACWRRVKAMEEAGVIRHQRAILNAESVGFLFSAIVHIRLQRHEQGHVETFIKAITGRREVLACFATTGEADYHLRVVCTDKEAYNRFLDEFLFKLPGVAHVRTNLILKEIKLTTELPV